MREPNPFPIRHKSHVVEICPYVNIKCKFCGSNKVVRYGQQHGQQQYMCQDCGRKFSAKDTLEDKQTPTNIIGAALSLFYDGLSLSAISRQIQGIYGDYINPSTVYRWVLEYSQHAIDILKVYKPKVGDTWVVDETVIDVGGKNTWFWDVIDEKTRFLLASHLSSQRTIVDVSAVMREAWQRADKAPHFILSDGLKAYPDGIERVFGADAHHIKSEGFTEDINTNLIERFHGTLKGRTKILRGFKTLDTAELILDGFIINYNFFRPHMTLGGDTTPAQEAGIKLPFKTWEGLLRSLQPFPKHPNMPIN